jgi:tRNA(Ile)-lysidine synthetase-like protein
MALADALVACVGVGRAVVFTVDHNLHARSTEVAEGVVGYWRGRGVEAVHLRADPALIARGEGVEDGARLARYAALEGAAARYGCALVLLAHHANDQAETLLMRLQGPSGPGGLGGIPERRGLFTRPWLSQRGAALKEYARSARLPLFEDPTNADARFLRNRVRLEVSPALEGCFGEGWELRAAQTARETRGLWEGARWFLAEALEGRVWADPWSVHLRWPEGLSAPEAAQRAALYEVWRAARSRLAPDGSDPRRLREHAEALWALWSGEGGRLLQLPLGLWAWGGGGACLIYSIARAPAAPRAPLEVEGVGRYVWGPWAVMIAQVGEGERDAASVPLSRAPLPWSLRAPAEGERFHPLGASGSKTIRRLWSDLKRPPIERDTLPLLVDGEGAQVWLPFSRPAERLRGGAGARWALTLERRDPLAPLSLLSTP